MCTVNPQTFATSEPAGNGTTPPDPEVLERPRGRRFSAEYRLRILRQAANFASPADARFEAVCIAPAPPPPLVIGPDLKAAAWTNLSMRRSREWVSQRAGSGPLDGSPERSAYSLAYVNNGKQEQNAAEGNGVRFK